MVGVACLFGVQVLWVQWAAVVGVVVPLVSFLASSGTWLTRRCPKILLRKGFHVQLVLMFMPSLLAEEGAVRLALGKA